MNPTQHKTQQYPTTYDYVKERDLNDIPETWTPLLLLDVPHRELGTYEVGMTMTYSFSSQSTSVLLRWRVNGGTWNVFESEPKDKTDDIPVNYFYPFFHKGGPFKLEIEGMKETATGVFDMHFLDAVLNRKG